MRVSTDPMSERVDGEIQRLLVQVIADIRSPEDADLLLSNLLSEAERTVIAKRLAIAVFLTEGQSYENIKRRLKVSSATVAKVQEMLDTPGINLALKKIKEDRWASQWAKRFSTAVEALVGKR
jgi:uncharacterized protein YerC